ncbi:MAG TPA: inositol monophosphatase family protein, partial [Vicinamibacterales bacterium]|nr:inositol monophosphatase family protein [Vicinamibacterales bacterium]
DERSLLLEAVGEVARSAGAVALRHFKSPLAIERKHDGSPVTIADRSAEQHARDWIASRFPDDGIVGEELASVRHGARRRWIIDPIDGTASFVRGVPLWGTLVAVCEGSEVLAGAACFPALGEIVSAAAGLGAWWNGARCAVSTVARLEDATVLTTDHRFTRTPECVPGWRRLASRASVARDWGDCYGYLLVATGRAEVMIDGILADWDAAALFPVIREAGGMFTDCAGRETPFGSSAVATNALLARDARALLDVPLPPTP